MMISIVILTKDSEKNIASFLKALKNDRKIISEIIVVDDGSTDKTVEILKNLKDIKTIAGKSFKNTAEAWNTGINKTSGQYIVLVKPEVSLPSKWYKKLKNAADKGFSCAGPLFMNGYAEQAVRSYCETENRTKSETKKEILNRYGGNIREVRLLSTDCMLLKRECIKNGRLFDESFNTNAFELAFSFHHRKSGLKLGCVLDIIAERMEDTEKTCKRYRNELARLFGEINKNHRSDFIQLSSELWGEKIWEYDNLIFSNPDVSVIFQAFDKEVDSDKYIKDIEKHVNDSQVEFIVISPEEPAENIRTDVKFLTSDSLHPVSRVLNYALTQAAGRYIFIDMDYNAEVFNEAYKIVQNRKGLCAVKSTGSLMLPKTLLTWAGVFDERFESFEFSLKDYVAVIENTGYSVFTLEGISTVHDFKDSSDVLEGEMKKFTEKWDISETSSQQINKAHPELDEKTVTELLEKGNEHVSAQQFDEAIACYESILESNPLQKEALNNLGFVRFMKGEKDKGIKILQRAIDVDPLQPRPYFSLGMIYYQEGDFKTASDYFRNTISKDVGFENAYDFYLRSAEQCGIKVRNDDADFVFYTSGISFDGATVYKRGLGGSETALSYMAKEIARRGYTVKVFNNCDNPGVYDGVDYRQLVDYHIFNRFNKTKVFISSRSFKPFFFDIHADVKIVWLHDTVNVDYLRKYDLNKLDFSDIKIFTLSKFHTKQWREKLNLPSCNFFITRNGFDPEMFDQPDVKRKKNKIIYTSRPIRGLEILLKVFPRIRERVPDAELHLFTYALSEKDNEIAPFMELVNQPGVILRGEISKKELAKELLESRVAAYPSIFEETSCISAIEAQAAGLPMVTTNLAALPETLRHDKSGIIIDGDARTEEYQDAFVEWVVRLMQNDRLWKRLSEGGKNRAYEIYPWSKVAEQWLEKIDEWLHESGEQKKRDEPSLSLCMIVKNEEENLPVCLESVRDIVDEIIIVDTGSTDGTKKVAEKFGAKTFNFTWTDDFSEARNFSLSKASGDWILYLDADEKIEKDDCRKIREVIKQKDIMAVNMLEYIPQEKGNLFELVGSDYSRLFRNHPEIRFEGAIHEQILPSVNRLGGKVLKSDIKINHWGFARTEEKRIERSRRNLSLLLKDLEKTPGDPFVHYNLGKTYQVLGEQEKAQSEYNTFLELKDHTIKNELIEEVYINLAQLHFSGDGYEEALKNAEKALEMNPQNIFSLYLISGVYFYQGKFTEAGEKLKGILEITGTNSIKKYMIDKGQVYTDLGNCHYRLGDFQKSYKYYIKSVEENGDDYVVDYNIGNSLLQLGKIREAMEWYTKAIELNPDFESARNNLNQCKNLLNLNNLV